MKLECQNCFAEFEPECPYCNSKSLDVMLFKEGYASATVPTGKPILKDRWRGCHDTGEPESEVVESDTSGATRMIEELERALLDIRTLVATEDWDRWRKKGAYELLLEAAKRFILNTRAAHLAEQMMLAGQQPDLEPIMADRREVIELTRKAIEAAEAK